MSSGGTSDILSTTATAIDRLRACMIIYDKLCTKKARRPASAGSISLSPPFVALSGFPHPCHQTVRSVTDRLLSRQLRLSNHVATAAAVL